MASGRILSPVVAVVCLTMVAFLQVADATSTTPASSTSSSSPCRCECNTGWTSMGNQDPFKYVWCTVAPRQEDWEEQNKARYAAGSGSGSGIYLFSRVVRFVTRRAK